MGKAKNLRSRVRSYFQPVTSLGPKTAALVGQISTIDYIEVFSEIEALLLESRLIKKFRPQFNVSSKDDKSPYYIHLSRETYPKPVINHESQNAAAGPFLNSLIPRTILRQFRRIAPYHSQSITTRPCLYSHLGLCNPCPGNPATTPIMYRKNITRLKRLLKGQFPQALSQMEKQMQAASRSRDFETAVLIRDKMKSLRYLLESPVSPEEYQANPNLVSDLRRESLDSLRKALMTAMNDATRQSEQPQRITNNPLRRIEMYDVSNLTGTAATAAMTVAQNGELVPAQYRHFTIRTKNTPDDVAMMKEVLARRLKRTDWPAPDLIVLDGGKSQLSIVKHLASRFQLPPLIALAKREEIITVPTPAGFREIKLDRSHPGLKLLQRLRDEAHRFSRRLHHKHRQKNSLI